MFLPLKFFWGAPAKILDRHYKIGPSNDHRSKFHAGRPTHLEDFALNKKNIMRKTEVLPKTMVFGRTNNRPVQLYKYIGDNARLRTTVRLLN